jgi:hypothetical protein
LLSDFVLKCDTDLVHKVDIFLCPLVFSCTSSLVRFDLKRDPELSHEIDMFGEILCYFFAKFRDIRLPNFGEIS